MLTPLLISLGILLGFQSPMARGQTYAVVVGIADYQALSYSTGDLRFADRDARQVVDFLQSKSGGNVLASHIRLLTNRQATQATIEQAMTLFQQAGANDRVILYFSGHGLPDSFVPYDARPGDQRKLLTYAAIKAAFRASKALTKLCIADACLSGGITRQQTNRSELAKTGRDGSNVAMLLASRSTQNAVEDRRLAGGAFTYFLLKGLTGQGDLNGDGIVTIRELHKYVAPLVRKRTKGKQTPVFYGRFSDSLPLAYL
ncbi:caspase family protein [Spirosoma foliorum]|uniref:Caspase family protein n=1 Tax=Spirosoma foliorum TaxID=2710596 RepID=A0A7G5GMW5_9BACT|nr:caspase family protein [Spirosoma foliorum]QMW00207.1 caspase family protein [Spirosoma foliorum]